MFYDRFIELCARNNVKPTTVSKSIGLSSATQVKWAKGSSPNMDALIKLANYFKCSIDYLCDQESGLEKDEEELLKYFREMNKDGRFAALMSVKGFSEQDVYKKRDDVSKVESE